MTTHTLWFYQNTVASPTPQHNEGPFTVTPTGPLLKAYVHGEVNFKSSNVTVPFVSADDMIWGLQWVYHGAGAEDLLTSATDNHWLWRHALANNDDVAQTWAPDTADGVTTKGYPSVETYRGQSVRPGAEIDLYLSLATMFGTTTQSYYLSGTIELYFG